jgi:hypothetical protein
MESLKKIEGIDRFFLITTSFIFIDLAQALMYASGVFWFQAWLWGILGSMIYGFIVNASFDVQLFGPRMGMKVLVFFLVELIPGVGVFSLLSVAMFIIAYFHNNNVDETQKGGGGSGV